MGANRYITEWDVKSGEELSQKQVFFSTKSVSAISKNGKSFVIGHQEKGNVRLWSTTSGQEGKDFKKNADSEIVIPIPELLNEPGKREFVNGVQEIAYSPDGKTVASAHNNNTIRFWDTASETERAILISHTEKINALAFSHDSTMLASGSEDNTIQLWDVQKGKHHATLTGHKNGTKALAFSPTEPGLLASGSADGTIRFWDVNIEKERSIFATGYTDVIATLSFTADNTMLVSAAFNGQISIWDMKTGTELPAPSLTNYDGTNVAAFSHDATLFVSKGYDIIVQSDGSGIGMSLHPHKETRLWRLPTGEELLSTDEGINALAISPDNKMLVTSNINETILWDVNTGAKLSSFEERQFVGDVKVGFSPRWDHPCHRRCIRTNKLMGCKYR